MAHDINKALETLEQNLKDLESARIQVEKTIKASGDLQSTVKEYASAVKALCVSLGQMGSDWDDREKAILDDFENRIKALTKEFSNETKEKVKQFDNQNKALSSSVEKLSGISTELSGIKQSLENKLDNLKDEVNELGKTASSLSESIKSKIDDKHDSILKNLGFIDKKADTILSRISEFEKQFSAVAEKTKKDSRINLIAIIVGIVLLVILHFI